MRIFIITGTKCGDTSYYRAESNCGQVELETQKQFPVRWCFTEFVCTGRAHDNVTTPTSRGRTRWVHAGCDLSLSEGIKMKLSSKGTESFRDKSFQIKRNNMQFMCCLNRSQAVSPLYFMSFILSWTNCTQFKWNTPGPERIYRSCMCDCVCSGLEKLAAACLKPQTPWMKNIWRHDGAVMSLLPPERDFFSTCSPQMFNWRENSNSSSDVTCLRPRTPSELTRKLKEKTKSRFTEPSGGDTFRF